MSNRSELRPLASSGLSRDEDAEAHEDWLTLLDITLGESIAVDTNLYGLCALLNKRHGDNAAVILCSDYSAVLCLNPGIDWDGDELDNYLHMVENGYHFDQQGYARALLERAQDYWDSQSYPDRINSLRAAEYPIQIAFRKGPPPTAVLDYLAEYFE